MIQLKTDLRVEQTDEPVFDVTDSPFIRSKSTPPTPLPVQEHCNAEGNNPSPGRQVTSSFYTVDVWLLYPPD